MSMFQERKTKKEKDTITSAGIQKTQSLSTSAKHQGEKKERVMKQKRESETRTKSRTMTDLLNKTRLGLRTRR
jgi:hypothetical protein